MFWLDPAGGRRRRALLRERIGSVGNDFNHSLSAAGRDLGHRAKGIRAQMRSRLARDEVSDEVLAERVRSGLGRVVSHPSAIEVSTTRDGWVRLNGAVLAHEYPQLLEAVCSVRGVREVCDELAVYEDSQGIPELQGGRPRKRTRLAFLRQSWPPSVRLLAGASGSSLLTLGGWQLFGPRPRRFLGACSLVSGGLLLARSLINRPMRQVVERARAIDIRKTLHVQAPIEQVFDALARYENFPSFMRNVRSVQSYPDGRSHWVVAGPVGTLVEWDAETMAFRPNEVIAWRTVGNAAVTHSGVIRLRQADTGTRVDIQMTYNPPAGALGHGVAKLFGVDPKHELDADLLRLKTFLESNRPPHDASRPTSAPGARPTATREGGGRETHL
jgi:uncharacterized membrane protein